MAEQISEEFNIDETIKGVNIVTGIVTTTIKAHNDDGKISLTELPEVLPHLMGLPTINFGEIKEEFGEYSEAEEGAIIGAIDKSLSLTIGLEGIEKERKEITKQIALEGTGLLIDFKQRYDRMKFLILQLQNYNTTESEGEEF